MAGFPTVRFLEAADGWCAPAAWVETPYGRINKDNWPPELTAMDLEWIARMLHLADIDVESSYRGGLILYGRVR